MQPPVWAWLQTSPHEVALSASHLLLQMCKTERLNTVINMKYNIINQITFWQEGLKTEWTVTLPTHVIRYDPEDFQTSLYFTAYFHKITWILLSNLLLCLEVNYFPEVLLIRILYTYYFPQLIYMTTPLLYFYLTTDLYKSWNSLLYNILSSSIRYFTSLW